MSLLNSSSFQVWQLRCDSNIPCHSPFVRASQSPDTKKEEFRRYLERSGVIDALTKGGLARKSHALVWSLPITRASIPLPPHPTRRASSLPLAVLVGLYEEPEKPANALECAPPRLAEPVPHASHDSPLP